MLKLKKNWPVVFEFLRPPENVTPDRILARLKTPFPYGRGIKIVIYHNLIKLNSFFLIVPELLYAWS